MENNLEFPNGVESYLETYYEVVDAISYNWDNYLGGYRSDFLNAEYIKYGRTILYNLAKGFALQFELLNKDRQWDGEFFDEIGDFMNEKLKNNNNV